MINKYINSYKNEISIAVIVVVFFFLIKGIFSFNVNWKKEVEDARILLKEKQQLVQDWQKNQEEYSNLQEGLFQNNDDLVKQYIEMQAKALGIDISFLSPSLIKKDIYNISEIRLKVTAPYELILQFIQTLENKNIFLKKLNIQGGSEKNKAVEILLQGFILWEK